MAKRLYDKRHRPIFFDIGSKVYLKLHKGYTIPSMPSKKLSNQRCGPWTVLRKIGNLAYKLDFPADWKIHHVVSVAQLEPVPTEPDPFERPVPDHPPPVEEFNDEWHDYEVDKLVGRRQRKYGEGKLITEYLVRWKGYGSAFNRWYSEDLLENSKDEIQKYENVYGGLPQQHDPPKPKRGRGRPRITFAFTPHLSHIHKLLHLQMTHVHKALMLIICFRASNLTFFITTTSKPHIPHFENNFHHISPAVDYGRYTRKHRDHEITVASSTINRQAIRRYQARRFLARRLRYSQPANK